MRYPEFFKITTGFALFPFQGAYQKRDRTFTVHTINAPTGLGKTETIVCDWLYGILYDRRKTPTRLVLILPMRSLTHQTRERVEAILKRLGNSEISVHTLVGGTGQPIDRDWLDCIDGPCIIIGTQDQILSRQLFRGFACSRWEWAMHTALLNNDVRIVCDETQLMGIAYLNSIILQKLRHAVGTYGLSELILCSATLDVAPLKCHKIRYQECGIGDADYQDKAAAKKLRMQKKLHRVEISSDYVAEIVNKVLFEYEEGTLNLVIVNQVNDAIAIADQIGKTYPTLLLHSRFRGADRNTQTEKLKGFRGIVVATQVVEAGIDLDARKLFSVPCSWASWVQRCGRAGRNGTYRECDVYLLHIKGMRSLPYEEYEIREFYDGFNQLPSAIGLTH